MVVSQHLKGPVLILHKQLGYHYCADTFYKILLTKVVVLLC